MQTEIWIAVLVTVILGVAAGFVGAFAYQKLMPADNSTLAYDHLVSKPMAEISSYTVLQMMAANDSSLVVLDVRNKAAYDLGHIKGAISMPFSDLINNYDQLPQGKTIVVYCWSKECMLGPTASAFLATKGILTKELRIGWCEWSERGYPVDGERYIVASECLEPQRSINNENVTVLANMSSVS